MDAGRARDIIDAEPENPAVSEPPSSNSRNRSSCFVKGLVVLLVVLLVLAGLWWWHNRPIRPVQLSAQEQRVVAAKVEALRDRGELAEAPAGTAPEAPSAPAAPAAPEYEKGAREIILTERELNGLLNQNTSLGRSVSFQLAANAIHARLEADLDPGLPLVGGKRLKARARFLVSESPNRASLVLDDVTVWGVSLPNDWLGGLKGQDMLERVLGGKGGGGGIAGVEEFRVEPGRLIIRLAE